MPMLVPNLHDRLGPRILLFCLCIKLMVSTGHGDMGEGGWVPHSPLSSEFQREVVVMVVVGMESNYVAEALPGP